jgi:phospholipid/cholesterol/gamma-HCH transport system substrate-binding protein
METRANYALIGAFTLAVIVGAFGFVLWFSGADKSVARKTYRMVFTSSVSGLSRGASVLFNGLKVGEVTSIGLAEDPRIVNALIDVDARTPIKRDTLARLESTGLTGVASVALSGGPASFPPIEKGADGSLPTINAEPSQLQNIIETLQNLSGKVDGLIARADSLLNENSQSITNTVKNVEKVTQAFADNSDGVKDLMAGLGSVGREMQPFAESLGRNAGSVDTIATNMSELSAKLNKSADKIDGVLAGAQNLVGSPGSKGMFDDIGAAAKSIRKLADNLDQRTKDITTGFNKITGPGLRAIESLTADGRRAVDEVNRATKSIQKNPQQFLFGAKPDVPEYSAR